MRGHFRNEWAHNLAYEILCQLNISAVAENGIVKKLFFFLPIQMSSDFYSMVYLFCFCNDLSIEWRLIVLINRVVKLCKSCQMLSRSS